MQPGTQPDPSAAHSHFITNPLPNMGWLYGDGVPQDLIHTNISKRVIIPYFLKKSTIAVYSSFFLIIVKLIF